MEKYETFNGKQESFHLSKSFGVENITSLTWHDPT